MRLDVLLDGREVSTRGESRAAPTTVSSCPCKADRACKLTGRICCRADGQDVGYKPADKISIKSNILIWAGNTVCRRDLYESRESGSTCRRVGNCWCNHELPSFEIRRIIQIGSLRKLGSSSWKCGIHAKLRESFCGPSDIDRGGKLRTRQMLLLPRSFRMKSVLTA
jgi:hypothetical protein